MPDTYDAIVIGLGGFGSGALYHLARRGVRVLGIEQFGVAHDRGSSHGETRIIRKAYFEHPDYVPLLVRAYELWRELESECGRTLMHLGGLMLAGPPEGEAIAGAKLAARLHRIQIEEIDAVAGRRRFPGFRVPEGFSVLFEPEAGYLEVENCVRAHLEQAVAHGALVHTDETVLDWTSDGTRATVRTDRDSYEAASLVITAGPWASTVAGDLELPLQVVRKPAFWHPVMNRHYDVSAGAPAFYFEMPAGAFYGFPSLDGATLKVAEHTGGRPVSDASRVDRSAHPDDIAPVAEFVRTSLPGIIPEPVRHSVCLYTLTPDHHFIIDRHPEHPNVSIGAGFSGHGFKFTTVLGQALADLAADGRTDLPIGFLSATRFPRA